MKRSTLIARQGRQPSGLLGHIVARVMARETHQANLVALDQLDLQPEDRLLEVGFGHGRTLEIAAQSISQGSLHGIDPSEVMQKVARRRNARAIGAGRMTLALGTADHLPYPDRGFDKVLSVHTVYFWADPARELLEIHRVMAPGGRLVLGYRPREDAAFVSSFPPEIYHIRPRAEIEQILAAAGFSDIHTRSAQTKDSLTLWTTATA